MVLIVADVAVALIAALVTWMAVMVARRPDPAAPALSPATIADQVETRPTFRRWLRRHLDPREAMGELLTVAVIAATAWTTMFGLVAVMVRLHTGLARWDRSASTWGADHANTSATSFLRAVSLLGSFGGGVVVITAVAVLSFARHRRGSMIAFMLTVTIGQTIITDITKFLVGRARPDIDRLTGFSGSSFPSGHSATAAALYAAAALVLGRGASRRMRAAFSTAAVGVATAVAASRVLLGVHWLTDVVGGLAMGWGWFAVVSIAFGGRWLHFGAPVETAKRIDESGRADRVVAVDAGAIPRPPDAGAVDRRGRRDRP